MKLDQKKKLTQKRRWRIRKKISGTESRPRLSLHFSNKHIYAQCIDDVKGHTLACVSTLAEKDTSLKANSQSALELGKRMAEKAKSVLVKDVVFDRGGRRYHGCVKLFADAARQGGLQF